MCGFIGAWNNKTKNQQELLNRLRHRGPDDQGLWFSEDGSCWLGHTRLAIQDLSSAGHQPMTSKCERFTIVFNGEIYNHQQLRESLKHNSWNGHSDTETLLEGFSEQGAAFLDKLHGMFAFAIYDNDERALLLGRDRFGIKPLYIEQRDEEIRFASERQALMRVKPSSQEITQLLSWGHISTEPYISDLPSQKIESVPPGSLLRIKRGKSCRIEQFWPLKRIKQERTTTLRHTLETVVREQLLSDVPVACFLSSGLDSGILTAIACRQQPGQIASFTVAFPGMELDESQLARRMAAHCGSDHHELHLDVDKTLNWIEKGLQSLDQPSADGLNTYLVSRAVAEQGIKVALSGLGADELFGGYPSHRLVPWLWHLRWLPKSMRLTLLRVLSKRLHHKVQDLTHWDHWHLSVALRRWASDRQLAEAGAEPLRWPTPGPDAPVDGWGQISWGELFGYTEPMLLRDSDVMSMASGLEIRVPFLDERVVIQALSLPRWQQHPGKHALRQSCADLFPKDYLRRRKQGFSLPMASWMNAELRPLCQNRINALVQQNWLEERWIRSQWKAFEQGLLPWPRAWVLVVLGEFARREQHQ